MQLMLTLRNNWKKTVFGLVTGVLGVDYGLEMYQISALMKSYSKEAALYGEQNNQHPKRVIVILNPAANKKKSEKAFRKYCEPILHLAGFIVDIVRTDSEGYAKTYVEHLKSLPNAVVIAGGDGTVSEVLTGMMRRNADRCPIALLPLGIRNDIAQKHLSVSCSSKLKQVKSLIDSSMHIARGNIVEKSVFKIEQISSESEEHSETRPIYALGYLEWGIRRDINNLQEKYWYFGGAKSYCAALLNAFNSNLSWSCKANVCYSTPCVGCTNCVSTEDRSLVKRKWWSGLLFKNGAPNKQNIVSNTSCKEKYNDQIDSSNVRIYVDDTSILNKLVLETGDSVKPGFSFIYKHLPELRKLWNENKQKSIECRTMALVPDDSCKGSSKFYSIDNEVYDVRPINLTLIPKAIGLYMKI